MSRRSAWLLVVIAAVLASAAGLDNGFAYDDLVVIADNASVHALRWPWEYFGESYWGPARGDDLYRPLAVLGFSVQWAIGGGTPFVFHLANVVLYGLSALAVLALASELMPPRAALLGALVFAVHPVHVEAVGNVVGQSELITAVLVLLAITQYVRDRKVGALRRRSAVIIAVLYALALFVKEHAIVLPALLVAAELALTPTVFMARRESGEQGARRMRSLLLALTLIAAAYLTVRFVVIGAVTGDAAHPGLVGIGAAGRAWVMLALLPEVARLMLWPARLYADYSPQLVAIHATPSAAHILGALVLLAWITIVAVSWRRSRLFVFLGAWFPITLLLASNVLVPTGVLIAERTLFLPSVGMALALGAAFAVAWPTRSETPTASLRQRWFSAGRMAVCTVLALGALRSSSRQSAWEDNAAVISTMVAEAPELFRGHLLLGETFAVNGDMYRAEPSLRRAVELYPGFPVAQIDFALSLREVGRCEEALSHFDAGLALDPRSQVAQVNRALCLLQLRRLREARQRAVEGLAEGVSPSAFQLIKWTADSLMTVTDSVDSRNLFARSGRRFDRSDKPVNLQVRFVLMPQNPAVGNLQGSSRSETEVKPK